MLMDREAALKLVKQHLSNRNLRRHCYAVEAVMRALAERLDEDGETWGLAGLLHDLDYEKTVDDPDHHTDFTIEWLKEHGGVSEEILQAIKAHAGNITRERGMDKAIYCVDPATGFIVACALMHPDKKLASLDAGFVMRRFNEKRFAAGAGREQIATCSELGLELEDFLVLSCKAMASIGSELGL